MTAPHSETISPEEYEALCAVQRKIEGALEATGRAPDELLADARGFDAVVSAVLEREAVERGWPYEQAVAFRELALDALSANKRPLREIVERRKDDASSER